MGEKKEKFYTGELLAASCVSTPEGYVGLVGIKDATVKFSIKNVVTSLAEGDIKIIIEPNNGMESRPLNFHLKAHSDSNKEALARQLKLAFTQYSTIWTLIVNDLVSSFIEALNNYKQKFLMSEIEGETKGWLFEPFIMEHSINVLFGMGSAGKTLIALYFSLLYGQGKTLWGKQGKQGNVLFIDFENDKLEWRDNLRNLLGKYPMDLELADKVFHYWQTEQIPLYNQVDKLKTTIRENEISLVIVDSASMAAGDSTSDEAAALKLMAALKLLDTSIILIAHQRKTEGEENPIGSIQYFNQARNIWNITGRIDEADERILHIGCVHKKINSGYKRKNPIGVKAFFGEGFIDVHLEDAISNFEEKFTLSDRIINALKNGGLTQKQIADELDKKESTIKTVLNRLKGRGKLIKFNDIWSNNISQ